MVSLFKLLVPRPLFLTVFVLVVVSLTLFIPELSDNPGYVLVAWKNLSVESSLLTAVFVVVFLVVGVALLTFAINRFVGWAFDAGRKQRRADKRTTRGLVALAEGNWSDAEKMLLKGAVKNESPLVNYITAAQAAQEQGEYDSRDEYLKRAHETTRGVDVAIRLRQVRQSFRYCAVCGARLCHRDPFLQSLRPFLLERTPQPALDCRSHFGGRVHPISDDGRHRFLAHY